MYNSLTQYISNISEIANYCLKREFLTLFHTAKIII
jgi:hypothetical protein